MADVIIKVRTSKKFSIGDRVRDKLDRRYKVIDVTDDYVVLIRLRVYGQWSGNEKGVIEDQERCVASVGEWIHHQCSNRRGYGPNGLYCRTHANVINRYNMKSLDPLDKE